MIGMTINESAVSAYFSTMIEEFKKKSYRVIVIADNNRDELINRDTNPIILTWPSKRPTKLQDIKFFMKEVKYYKPDIIIGNFGSVSIMNVVGCLLGVPTRLAWAHTVSTAIKNASMLSKVRKRLVYKCATNIIANSNAMKTDLIKYTHINPEKIEVFTNAIELKKRDELSIKRDENLFVYVGGLYKNKGIDVLIDAFGIVQQKFPEKRLKIVGPGKAFDYFKAYVHNKGLDDVISLIGGVHRDNVYKEYASAMCCVVPSRHEAFGYVVVEAMAERTVVIGSDIEGISEIIDDGLNGLLFNPQDRNELAEKMEFVIRNKDKRDVYIENGYKTLVEKFNVNRIAESFVEFCDKKIEKE